MNSRISIDEYFLRLAELVSSRSTCLRRAVGCVLVDHANHVLSTGYNGVARGQPHCNEGHPCPGAECRPGEGLHLCAATHAETNALVQCHDISAIHTVYCTASPCVHCMRLILGTEAKRVVFREEYPHAQSRGLALRAGLEWVRLGRL